MHLSKVPPGAESTASHTHSSTEEFIYVLSGTAMAVWGHTPEEAQERAVGPGDFMGFTRNGPSHKLINTGSLSLERR